MDELVIRQYYKYDLVHSCFARLPKAVDCACKD